VQKKRPANEKLDATSTQTF